jgi:nicotinamide-nucleotide amidase
MAFSNISFVIPCSLKNLPFSRNLIQNAMKALKTDCAVATSGIAGPGGGTPEKPVGTVWIAAGYKNEIRTYKQETNRGRTMNIERAGNNALLILRDLLK